MKHLVIFFAIIFSLQIQAKQIKFSVNMSAETVSPNGVHLVGDFQVLAGFGTQDFDPSTIQLFPEQNDTNIYSRVLDLPAFHKYEYRFINGDLSYETEFVSEKSRVGYDSNDNRWLYLDSIANDTTNVGAIIFSGNAPSGKTMLRVLVDVSTTLPTPTAVKVAGSFVNLNSAYSKLYSFGNNVFENIYYLNSTSQSYKFYSGNNTSDSEIVPSSCNINGSREVVITTDSIIDVVCFSACTICSTSGFKDNYKQNNIAIYPNPIVDNACIKFGENSEHRTLYVYDNTGKSIFVAEIFNANYYTINCSSFSKGVYEVVLLDSQNKVSSSKLVVK